MRCGLQNLIGFPVRTEFGHSTRSDKSIIFDRSHMLILKAEGSLPDQRAIWEIDEGCSLLLGRGNDNDCSVPWDQRVSRRHARVSVTGERLSICCLPDVSNLIWNSGSSCMKAVLSVGDSFRIGQTRFNVEERKRQAVVVDIVDTDPSEGSHTSSIMMNTADVRLAMVSSSAAALWTASSDKTLAQKAVDILRRALTFADLFVVLSCDDESTEKHPDVIHWHVNQETVEPSVSRDLVLQAVTKRNAALLVDADQYGAPIQSGRWSFCVPMRSDAATSWCLYVGGAFGPTADHGPFLTAEKLKPDVILTELVSHLAGAVRSVRSLESKFDGIRQFFSPQLLEKISGGGAGASSMAPRETKITALYCDLRGFSRMVSRSSGDLHGLLRRISRALGVMTQSIIEHQGVIADFQGDSALGFWGWPLALTDGPLPACRAALQIRDFFAQASQKSQGALKGFRVGIGIATGRAIAGRIGTRDHAKIGIFGPVVNVASRLEGLTTKTGASILMDSITCLSSADLCLLSILNSVSCVFP